MDPSTEPWEQDPDEWKPSTERTDWEQEGEEWKPKEPAEVLQMWVVQPWHCYPEYWLFMRSTDPN